MLGAGHYCMYHVTSVMLVLLLFASRYGWWRFTVSPRQTEACVGPGKADLFPQIPISGNLSYMIGLVHRKLPWGVSQVVKKENATSSSTTTHNGANITGSIAHLELDI